MVLNSNLFLQIFCEKCCSKKINSTGVKDFGRQRNEWIKTLIFEYTGYQNKYIILGINNRNIWKKNLVVIMFKVMAVFFIMTAIPQNDKCDQI